METEEVSTGCATGEGEKEGAGKREEREEGERRRDRREGERKAREGRTEHKRL